ncbi:Rne/Rng family ribonuclease [Corynebacterium striatum]|uniref:Ribonuclease E n=1 Tax=Corynebacterium striatum TaxID=43770 RepID=A0ABC8CIX1_CORST|nr:translation initiation factor IF-2 N-terminal domain-containing protein [Corynebacterium striatum]ATZ08466.1 ribonuclease E [Corynebacterium striatum]EGT5612327.1 Rne/Rng family ribonuclease [Corynebacterium striatum]KAA1263694.1 Rne/Rng family ribonuclease [Corynebacterium striatum]MDK8788461.1 translation initiation factor IF-2 N-terminal domain-containing protein [Corynebacterium striatum]
MATKKTETKKNENAKTTTENPLSAAAAFAQKVDRASFAAKTRLHTVAKQIGLSSKELAAEYAELGVKKAAQSSLTPEEIGQVFDAIIAKVAPAKDTDAAAEAPAKKTTKRAVKKSTKKAAQEQTEDPTADEKLRNRVRKNVENEISQIEEKVEAELVDAAEEQREEHQDRETRQDREVQQDTGTVDVEKLHEALVEAGDDFDEDDYAPVITPMPDDEPEVYDFAPIFMAPKLEKPAPRAQREDSRDDRDDREGDDSHKEESRGGGRRRGSRGTSRGRGGSDSRQDARNNTDEPELIEEPKAIKGSTRIEAQRRRRAELREKGRVRQHIVSQAEFLARRESVERTMVVRDKERTDGAGIITQVGVLEDDLLVEHFVTTEAQTSLIGNIYLGRVQNVLPSMEAAFIDIGQGRNGVLYAGEVDWRAAGLGGRGRKIENALKSGDQVLVQVAKDPIGHKGARLTTQISLAGRYLVYVPGGRSAGISRKLPVPERKRLKGILERVIPGDGGAIIRTAAENVSEEAIATDVNRLHNLWEDITKRADHEKSTKGAKPVTLYEEPDLLVKVVRDLFNEDFTKLIVDGRRSYNTVSAYVDSMAHDLADRVEKYDAREHGGEDAFVTYRIDEQLHKALSRKVWLPSGGTLVIDRTEAMTVIDVNTGKFTGSGGNLEETVTRNNLEAAEEIVRQMRLRDLGGMIVVDFIDMVLPENQELVLRRLKEALGRDRTRHQVSEVTSLGLVQMTRKRLGTGLIETFSTECEACHGRGIIIHEYPVDEEQENDAHEHKGRRPRRERRKPEHDPQQHPAAVAMHRHEEAEEARAAASNDAESHVEQKTSIEDLVAGIIVNDDKDEKREHNDSQENNRKQRRGRRSRRSNRQEGHTYKEQQDSADDIARIGYAAADNAAELDDVAEFNSYVADEEPQVEAQVENQEKEQRENEGAKRSRGRGRRRSARTNAPQKSEPRKSEQTYEEAVAEFEASPRRKRRTRGNSRSDHRPQPQDFLSPAKHHSEEAKPEQRAEDKPKAAARRARGRRRAVRHTTVKAPQAAVEQVKTEETPAEETKVIRRGRKRAVRKVVARKAPQNGAGETSESAAQPKEKAKVAKKADKKPEAAETPKVGTRGRRRVARRSAK